MKLRHKASGDICYSGSFNTSSISEIIVHYPGGWAWNHIVMKAPALVCRKLHLGRWYRRGPGWWRRLWCPPDCTSDYISDYDVLLGQNGYQRWLGSWWISLDEALQKHYVIHDNYNTRFFEPPTHEDHERGYTL
jgi:hypothetical protein